MSPAADGRQPRIAIVADDLIWSTRLIDGVRRAGGEPLPIRRASAVESGLVGAAGVIVDTTARAYDPLAVLRAAASTGLPSIAVAPHEDVALLRAAREAGAGRVYPYRLLFEHGDRELAAWIRSLAGAGAGAETA